MFKKNDKRRLYELMDMYLSEKIDAQIFCDEYYYCFGLELDYTTLTKLESQCFSDLETVSGRFSEFKEDHQRYPGAYFTEEQLKEKILDTKKKLATPFTWIP